MRLAIVSTTCSYAFGHRIHVSTITYFRMCSNMHINLSFNADRVSQYAGRRLTTRVIKACPQPIQQKTRRKTDPCVTHKYMLWGQIRPSTCFGVKFRPKTCSKSDDAREWCATQWCATQPCDTAVSSNKRGKLLARCLQAILHPSPQQCCQQCRRIAAVHTLYIHPSMQTSSVYTHVTHVTSLVARLFSSWSLSTHVASSWDANVYSSVGANIKSDVQLNHVRVRGGVEGKTPTVIERG